MDLEEKRRLMRNWRGRRLLVCRAIADLHDAIENLQINEGDPYPSDFNLTVTEAEINELQNQATVLLRSILLRNDGHVSPSKLQRF